MDWVEVNGTTLRYKIEGSGPETLVLIHEIGGSIESWDESVAGFSPHFRVVTYDQRGFGLSEKTSVISIDGCVQDLAALLDALKTEYPVHIAASAMGAAIAIAFAAAYPSRVKKLVISSPATGGLPASALASLNERVRVVKTGGMRATVDVSLQRSYPESLRENQARFVRYRHRWMTNDPVSFGAITELAGTMDLNPLLALIKCPTLVVGCSKDVIRPPAQSKDIAARIPDAKYVEAESGHFMAVQTPDLFVDTAMLFFNAAA